MKTILDAAKQAIEALSGVADWVNSRTKEHPWDQFQRVGPAIAALQEAIAEAESPHPPSTSMPEMHEAKCQALAGGKCSCAESAAVVDKAWARFCAGIGDGPNAPYPGMITAFESYYSQSFADKDWRTETAIWAAAWKAAKLHSPQHLKEAEQQQPVQTDEDAEYYGLEPWQRDAINATKAPSPTAGMNMAQRILHVGGRNPPGSTYVEFGSIQAVEALVRQVVRDLPAPTPQQPKEWVGLTEQDIWDSDSVMEINSEIGLSMADLYRLSRTIEAALKAKNGDQP